MIGNTLADLDALVLLCRDEQSKNYIAESVSCYKAGAYRAAIVSTWVSVCFDIIEKLRELAQTGDLAAAAEIKAFDAARAGNKIEKLLEFERSLLVVARDKFELLSHAEFVDLDRLKEDRNRCAHPSWAADDQVFMPSAELARLHIRSAVTHLLQYQPVQGKAALARLLKSVESTLFPADAEKAITILSAGPLKRPRESLLRDFVIASTKRLLLQPQPLDAMQTLQTIAAIKAARKMHGLKVEGVLSKELSNISRKIEDVDLWRLVQFLIEINDCWQYLDQVERHRLESLTENLSSSKLSLLYYLKDMSYLQSSFQRRLNVITTVELSKYISTGLPMFEGLWDRALKILAASAAFGETKQWILAVRSRFDELLPSHVQKILLSTKNNSNILNCYDTKRMLFVLRGLEIIPTTEFNKLIGEYGLVELVEEGG